MPLLELDLKASRLPLHALLPLAINLTETQEWPRGDHTDDDSALGAVRKNESERS